MTEAESESLFTRVISSERVQDVCPGGVFIEGWTFDNDLRAKWQKYGYMSIYAFWRDGMRFNKDGDPIGVQAIDGGTPYGKAIGIITQKIALGELPHAAYESAMNEMLCGTFDESPWARFLPTPEEEV